jgi:thioredoxin reductase
LNSAVIGAGWAGLAAAAPLGQMLAMCPFWLHLKQVFSAIGVLGALFDVAVA